MNAVFGLITLRITFLTIFHEAKASFILMKESAKNLITNLERKLQKEIQNNGKQIFVILNTEEFS